MRPLTALFAIVFALALSLKPLLAHAQDINSVAADAKTAADHEAIAKHFDGVAADLNAKEHSDPITTYSFGSGSANSKHCDKMINDLNDSAKQAEALAEAHRKMAAPTK